MTVFVTDILTYLNIQYVSFITACQCVKQRTEGIPSNHLGDIRKWPTLGCPKMGYATIATCTRSRENSDEPRDAYFQTNPLKKK